MSIELEIATKDSKVRLQPVLKSATLREIHEKDQKPIIEQLSPVCAACGLCAGVDSISPDGELLVNGQSVSEEVQKDCFLPGQQVTL